MKVAQMLKSLRKRCAICCNSTIAAQSAAQMLLRNLLHSAAQSAAIALHNLLQ
jgi:hypothetical protein